MTDAVLFWDSQEVQQHWLFNYAHYDQVTKLSTNSSNYNEQKEEVRRHY